MNKEIRFPRLGEMVRYLISTAGVLSGKYPNFSMFDDASEKVKFQKKMERLASEEGRIQESLDEVLRSFNRFVSDSIGDWRAAYVIECTMRETLNVIIVQIKDNGTCLPLHQSIEFLVESVILPRVILSISKHSVMAMYWRSPSCHYIQKVGLMPVWDKGKVVMPLSKVLKEIYTDLGVSQTEFHSDNSAITDKSLKSAQRWTSGATIPTWPELRNNIERSFNSLNKKSPGSVSIECKVQSISALFISRWVSQIYVDLLHKYGESYFEPFVRKARYHLLVYKSENRRILMQGVQCLRKRGDRGPEFPDRFWYYFGESYWKNRLNEILLVVEKWQNGFLLEQSRNPYIIDHAFYNKWSSSIPSLALLHLNSMNTINSHCPSVDFADSYLSLKRLTSLEVHGASQVEAVLDRVNRRGHAEVLGWLINWVYSRQHTRVENFHQAHKYSKIAFEKAKYAAGRDQYKLVNHHIELCSKVDSWMDFKRSVAWAVLMGIPVRYLRGLDDPESNKSLRHCFEFMKIGSYIN